MRFPPTLNCFQTFVPSGNFHSFGSLASIRSPFGNRMKRCLSAPSDQSGTAGWYSRTPSATTYFFMSAYRPVHSRRLGGTDSSLAHSSA